MEAITRRELETWEKRRREQAAEEARKRVEQKGKSAPSSKRFPVGYGADGRVPGYVEAYLLALQASPLGKPVFSPGRRRVRPDCMRLPSPSPERRQFVQGAPPASIAREKAKKNACTSGSRSLRARPASSSGRCSTTTKNPQKKTCWAERSSLSAQTRSFTDPHGGASSSDSLVRPATAPASRPSTARCAPPVKTRRHCPGGGQRRSLSTSFNGEEQLLKKIARLSGVRQASEHPTVATLKHAVAIRAIQAQLRDCRRGDRAAGVGSAHQAVSGVVSSSPERQAGSNTGINTRCSTKRRGRRRGFEVWDNRAPFIPEAKSQPDRVSGPIAPPPLKVLTCGDPVFGISEESPRRFASASRSAYDPGDQEAPTVEEQHQEVVTVRGGKEPSGGVSSAGVETTAAAAAAAAAREVEGCFRRLTISALIELNCLQHPPKPVRVVLSGLACLLGWQRKRSQRKAPPRSLFSNAYVLRNVMASVRPERITSRRLSAVTKKLDVQEAAPARVKGANAAASVLLDWLQAVVACARAHEAQ